MEILRQRLRNAFSNTGLNADRFVRFVPKQQYCDYLELMRLSDDFPDTFGWSVGLTTLDSVGCSLPLATHPCEFMRGRHSCGIPSQVGMHETIANSIEEYIEIAVRIGCDADWSQ